MDENAEQRLARMKAMHRARAKQYYAKKKMTRVERPEEPTGPSESSESASSDSDVSECRVKRRRMDSDVIIPYSDIKKCVKKALREQKEKKGNGAGYAAAAVGGIGLISAVLNRLPGFNPMRFLGLSDTTNTLPMELPSQQELIVPSAVLPCINVGE